MKSDVRHELSSAGELISVLLVEAHALRLAALRALLSGTPGLSVTAEARDLSTARSLVLSHRPDVVLVDGRMFAAADSEEVSALRRAAPESCVLVLTDDTSARLSGNEQANGCLSRDADLAELCATVISVLGARCSNCALRSHCLIPQLTVGLSRRERQVAIRVANGFTSKEVAADLGISPRTVNTYRENLARKLGASSAAVVTRFVLRTGLTEAGA